MNSQTTATPVEQWGRFELAADGPQDGNPFVDVFFEARFYQDETSLLCPGFYDGEGVYKVRFMPPSTGTWRYVTRSSASELDGLRGEFEALAPTGNNHGPVRVRDTFHFAYADGTTYKPIGTTCYAWTHQDEALQEQTLATLAAGPFNKIRMCVFPKRYDWNHNEPLLYPFEGTPPRTWDKERLNPAFFAHLEKRIDQLAELGIECDLILLHPYDEGHWGFDRMTAVEDDRYVRYVVARLGAFRSVWWSLANEYDFMKMKKEADWDRIFGVVTGSDPYGHLCSIHNGFQIYNHTYPWVTHASIQNGSAVVESERAVLYRDVYRKPIVFDEVVYEGDIPRRWGNLSAEEMVHRFWEGTIAGTYVGHAETYDRDDEILWWSKGGVLHGESPARLAFLRQVLEDGPEHGIDAIDKWQNPEYAGVPGEYYLVYFGTDSPGEWTFRLPKAKLVDGLTFKAEILDTWNMTVTSVEGTFTIQREDGYFFADVEGRSISVPNRPWMALRIGLVPSEGGVQRSDDSASVGSWA